MHVPPRRIAALAVAVGLLAALIGGCTDDVGGQQAATTATSSASGPAAPAPEVRIVPTRTRKGAVSGRIGKGDRLDVVKRVSGVVDRWLGAAYVDGEYPRSPSDFDAGVWPGFTDGATRTAKADKDLMSNADIAERIAGVVVKRREIAVDVLAVDRTARAATARVRLAFTTTGDLERRVTVTGRVFLTKRHGRWKVFGYDVAKARV